MAPPNSKTTPGSFIGESLQSFTPAELTDVIRIAQRLLKAKVQQERADATDSGKGRSRFWDKPLDLDWNAAGLPKVQYPGPKSNQPEIDWRVFHLLKGSGRESFQVDWDVFNLLAPERKAKEVDVDWDVFQLLGSHEACEPEAEPDSLSFLAIDWSGDRLPRIKVSTPPRRRPGCPGRVRSGKYHRAIEPSRRTGLNTEESGLANVRTSVLRTSALTKASPMLSRKARWSACRVTPRIQQPCGGGR